MKVQVTVCDMDPTEVGKATMHYTITRDGERTEMDLCKDHAGPIETLLFKLDESPAGITPQPVKKTAAKKTTTPRRRSTAKVVSLEDIEKLKQS
jgi:hypothetical protein